MGVHKEAVPGTCTPQPHVAAARVAHRARHARTQQQADTRRAPAQAPAHASPPGRRAAAHTQAHTHMARKARAGTLAARTHMVGTWLGEVGVEACRLGMALSGSTVDMSP